MEGVQGVSRLILLLFLLGIPFTAGAESDESTLFTQGYEAYQRGENAKAIETLADVLKRYPDGRVTDLVLFWLGKAYEKAGRTQDAVAAYRDLQTKYPKSTLAPRASQRLAKLEKDQQKEPAEVASAKAPESKPAAKPETQPKVAAKPEPKPVVKPPAEPPAAPKQEARQEPKKGAVPDARKKAIEAYERIIQKAPDSPEAARARERLAEMRAGKKPISGRVPLQAPPAGETVFLVVERVAGVDVSSVSARYTAVSGETIAVPFVLTNRGNAEDAFLLTATLPPAFQPAFFHDVEGSGKVKAGEPSVSETPRLAIGQKAQFVLQARLPVEMNDGATQAFEIKVSSKSDQTVSQAAPTTLVASAPALRGQFSLDHGKVKPGDTVSYTLNLSNTGSADARSARIVVVYPGTLRLAQAAPASTSADPQAHSVAWDLPRLAPNDRRAVRLDFRVGEDALAEQDLVVRALLQSPVGERTVSVVSPAAKVEAVTGVSVAGAEAPRTVFPRETVSLPFTLRNTGNGPDRFAVRVQGDVESGITLVEDRNRDGIRQPDESVVETTRLLNPQEEMALLAELNVPPAAPDATRHSIRLSATSERSKSAAAEAARVVVVSRPVVAVATQMAAKEGIPGKVFSYQLVCTNTGTSPARRVLVSENLPPELEFVDAHPRPGRIEGHRVAWEIADLGSGQREVLTVGVRVKSGIPAGTAVRKTTAVRYRDLKDQVYESGSGRELR
jgi:uncharacterized repeat protein (TIGR01451 family)